MYGTIVFGLLYGELDMGVNRVDMLEKLVTMSSLLDNKGVIHVAKPESGWIGAELMVVVSNSSLNRFKVSGLIGEPMAAPWTCSKNLTLEDEVGILKAELQQGDDLLD